MENMKSSYEILKQKSDWTYFPWYYMQWYIAILKFYRILNLLLIGISPHSIDSSFNFGLC